MSILHEWMLGLVYQDIKIDDAYDRLNRKDMASLLLLLLLPIIGQQYVGEPIQCMAPTAFSDAQVAYLHSRCWTESTYYILAKDIPHSQTAKTAEERILLRNLEKFKNMPYYQQNGLYISGTKGYVGPTVGGTPVKLIYYQFVPVVITIMALLFFLPYYLWKENVQRYGIDLVSLMRGAATLTHIADPMDQIVVSYTGTIKTFVEQFSRYVKMKEMNKSSGMWHKFRNTFCIGIEYGNSLFFYFIFIKILYLLNLIFQVYFMTTFLRINTVFALLRDSYTLIFKWEPSGLFPFNTVCHFSTTRDGEPQPFTVECTLPINLFNDKIFSIIIMLYQILAALTFFNIIRWLILNSTFKRKEFVRNHLGSRYDTNLSKTEDYVLSRLHRDAVFILQLIELNVGGVVVSNILAQLYSNYEVERKMKSSVGAAFHLSEDTGVSGSALGLDPTIQFDKKGRPVNI